MTWSWGARGTLEECKAQLRAGEPPTDPGNASQYKAAMAIIKDELDHYGDGSKGMSISASGHAPGNDGGDRSFSIWISGKAQPPAAKPAAKASASPPAARTGGHEAEAGGQSKERRGK